MLKILVGDAQLDTCEDVNFGTTWSEMLPREQVKAFDEYYFDGAWPAETEIVIRVYNGTIINWIGEQIDNNRLSHTAVTVYTEVGKHTFNPLGMIDATWPYGIFNY